jgi:hypothetical protein
VQHLPGGVGARRPRVQAGLAPGGDTILTQPFIFSTYTHEWNIQGGAHMTNPHGGARLECLHEHHRLCLRDWLLRTSKCPTCRADIGRRPDSAAPADIERGEPQAVTGLGTLASVTTRGEPQAAEP